MRYNVARTLARFFVALSSLGCKQAIDKYTLQWLLLTLVALLLAVVCFMWEQWEKHQLAE